MSTDWRRRSASSAGSTTFLRATTFFGMRRVGAPEDEFWVEVKALRDDLALVVVTDLLDFLEVDDEVEVGENS